ncbi:MAG: discoidin domain-containing protein [Clostridia bacterium]|nr:discoidin domain-containing protein [Clostridia bacterium]
MKKIAILLAVAMLLGIFALAACTPAPAESSNEPAPAASSEEPAPEPSSEEPAPEPSSEEPAPEPSSEEPAPEPSSEEPAPGDDSDDAGDPAGADPTTVKTSTDVSKVSGDNLALNASLKGPAVNTANPDYCANLTDGKASTTITYDNNWFGLYYQDGKDSNAKDGEAKFVVDLGEVKSIAVIRANFFLGAVSGIQSPDTVKFEVSEDGKKFVSLGKQSLNNAPENDTTIGWVGYSLEENVNAQYVRMTVKVRGVWTFLNEIEVYG